MKTKILYLENSDSPASIRDKMDRAAGSRILLVPPPRNKLLQNRLDLQVIGRHARSLGSEIALITRDHLVQDHGKILGIPIFTSLRVAQRTEWEKATAADLAIVSEEDRRGEIEEARAQVDEIREKKKQLKPVQRNIAFFIGVAAFAAVMLTILPRAEIRLQPRRAPQEIEIKVRASENFTTYNLSGDLPLHSSLIIVEGRDSIPTSGTIDIPEGTAVGEVTFTNLTGDAITIPEGTRLISSQGVSEEFATTSEAELPAGAGSTANAPVTALNPGEEGNVAAGIINVVDGPLGLTITVTNPEATSGGNNRRGPGPRESDYTDLRSRLVASLWQSAINELQMSLAKDDYIVSSAPIIRRVLQEQFNPEAPQATNTLSLQMQIEFEIYRVSGSDIRGMLAGILNGSMPDGFESENGTLEIEHIGTPVRGSDNTAVWSIAARRIIRSKVVPAQVREEVKGLSRQQAEAFLAQQYDLETPARLEIYPSWWPTMPFTPVRIQVYDR